MISSPPGGPVNPFAPVATIFGMQVVLSPDVPRYTLPAEVIPGVPWPPGFREEVNAWAFWYLGTTNTLPLGTVLKIGDDLLLMRREDLARAFDAARASAPTAQWVSPVFIPPTQPR